MSSLLKTYQNLLQRYPVIVSSLQTGILVATGDVIAQTIVEKRPITQMNFRRTGEFFIVGSCFIGPVLTVWYRFLANTVKGNAASSTIKKVCMDQLMFAPVCIAAYLSTVNLVQGKTFEYTKQEIQAKYADILVANYKIWPLVQLGNFYLVPLQYQVLLVQVVAVIWNAYLSWKTRQETPPKI